MFVAFAIYFIVTWNQSDQQSILRNINISRYELKNDC